MATNKPKIKDLLLHKKDLQREIRKIDDALFEELENFHGSLMEALERGLVKPAFPIPRGFARHLREKRLEEYL
jgi:hypothetical protein